MNISYRKLLLLLFLNSKQDMLTVNERNNQCNATTLSSEMSRCIFGLSIHVSMNT